jgi:hypothetical protein
MSLLDKIKSMFSGGASADTDARAGHDHSHAGDDHSHDPVPATPDPVPATPDPVPAAPDPVPAPNPVAEDETRPE